MSYLSNSRRNFLKVLTTSSIVSATGLPVFAQPVKANPLIADSPADSNFPENERPDMYDGPASSLFKPVSLKGNINIADLAKAEVSKYMSEDMDYIPKGDGIAWGIPFKISEKIIHLRNKTFSFNTNPVKSKWLVFLHTSDYMPPEEDDSGFFEKPFKGRGQLNEHVADYIIIYSDGTEETTQVRERFHIGMFQQMWGENCFEAVAHHKPRPVRAHHEQTTGGWGWSQTRASAADRGAWINWLWAWENPHPEKTISGFRFVPKDKVSIVLSAITAGDVKTNPLRWNQREKALLTLPEDVKFEPDLDNDGLLSQISLDLGTIISATPRLVYPKNDWTNEYNNKIPKRSSNEILIEYTAHPEASFHFMEDKKISMSKLKDSEWDGALKQVEPAMQKV
ncbi:MAG: hypothetical protein R3182_14455, partial [Draconibacterium sp.]|nr:hypothetical protein [Draconibacterium sp.]